MARFIKKRGPSKNEVPGSLIFIGEKKMEQVRIRVIEYDKDGIEETECQTLDEALPFLEHTRVTWLNIDGIHDKEVIERIGSHLGLHTLLMEDIMDTDQRPKYEEEDGLINILMKFVFPGRKEGKLVSEQLALLLGQDFLITFQEQTGVHFEPIRERLRKSKGRIRSAGADYLAYTLLDAVVDNYLEIIGNIGDDIETMENEVLYHNTSSTGEKMFQHKTEMSYLRKTVRPVREISEKLIKTESRLIRKQTRKFLSDFNDHVMFALESTDAYISLLNDQMNTYNANLSNKANDIMKILTVFASVFIPMSFVTGVYGMNFKIIPELEWEWGYGFFWGIILLIAVGFFIYFKRKRWL